MPNKIKKAILYSSMAFLFILIINNHYHPKIAENSQRISIEEKPKLEKIKIDYDPSLCKIKAGDNVYVALGKMVFRIPVEQAIDFGGLSKEAELALPIRPDPKQPEGCPNNPIAVSSATIMYRHQAIQDRQTSDNSKVDRLRLIATYPNNLGMQDSYEHDFKFIKDKFKDCEEINSGMTACYAHPLDNSIPKDFWGAAYQANDELYKTPLGRPFTISCYPSTYENGQCNISYNLYEGFIRITYRFDRDRLPIENIIEYDKGLRDFVETMRINDYVWPNIKNQN